MLKSIWDFLVRWAEQLEEAQMERARHQIRNRTWIE